MTRGWALFWGLVLVAVGGFALLFNLGLLQPEQLGRLAQLWPVLVILVGAQIVLARLLSRNVAAIALAVLAFLILAGTVGYVTSAPPVSQQHATFSAVDAGTGPATLQVGLGAATIEVSSGRLSGEAATAAIDFSSSGSRPELRWDRASRTFDISHPTGAWVFGPSAPDHLTVTLSSALAWTVELNTGASTATLDLGAIAVRRVSLDGGASTLNLTLGPPGGHVAVEINGGASRVQLARPAAAAVRVQLSGGANSLQVDGRDVGSGIGSLTWSSPGYPAADAIDVTVNGGANRLSLTSTA